MDEEDFIPLDPLPTDYKEKVFTPQEFTYINRGYCDYEPVELQLKN